MTKHSTILGTVGWPHCIVIFSACLATRADIFKWEYINPANPGQGKQPSATLAPDGAGVSAVPGANLSNRNLTMAYLIGANLSFYFDESENIVFSDLTAANLSQADLTNAYLITATLTGANFTGVEVRGARFGDGLTLAQLYSTASYQAHDLTGIALEGNNLSGANLAGQNLTNADFFSATLTGANLTGAEVRGANLGYSGRLRPHSSISTASYQAHDLTGIGLVGQQSGRRRISPARTSPMRTSMARR